MRIFCLPRPIGYLKKHVCQKQVEDFMGFSIIEQNVKNWKFPKLPSQIGFDIIDKMFAQF